MNKLLTDFIELATQHGDYMENGDIRANSVHKKLMRIIKKIEASETSTKLQFKQLLEHSNSSVKSWVAVELLGTCEQLALETLKSVSEGNGINALTANSLMDMWNKRMIEKDNWNV